MTAAPGAGTIELPRAARPLVSIIIPSATLALARTALAAIARNAPRDIAFETIVVADGAPDLQPALLAATSGVEVLATRTRRGLPGACNVGRAAASGQLLSVLHDDAEIESGWMEALVDAAGRDARAGAVGGTVLDPDGSLQGAGMILWRDATGSPPWSGAAPEPGAFATPRYVDFCGTSSLTVRAAVWDEVGGLSEDFYPAYYVDVDLAMAVRASGRQVLFEPRSIIRHRRGASSSTPYREFLGARNRERLIARWRHQLEADHLPRSAGVAVAVEHAARRTTTANRRVAPRRPVRTDAEFQALADEVRGAYVEHLERRLEAADAELAGLRHRVAALERERSQLEAATSYVFGTRLPLSEGGLAHRYPLSGGHGAEAWGMWLGDEPLRMALPVAPGAPGRSRTLRVVVEVRPYLEPGRDAVPLRVTVNGRGAVEAELVDPSPQAHHAQVELAPDERRLFIEISGVDGERCAAPAPAGDPRRLSVGVAAVTVEELRHPGS